ncbi:MAG: LacI family transcriptional regulator [Chloroflexi bacterium]|nr:LacI family transcriptional regulator [Chloroflexota bacterium]
MRDVARATGVSQSTVSRVLSGAPTSVPIADDTRERVVAVARTLGYRPNPLARGLRGMRTMLLGVIVRDITDPFFAGAIEAVSIEAGLRGYNVVLGHAHGRADEAIALWGVLEARHCDAILLLGDMSDQPQLIDDLRGSHVPVVALWQGSARHGIASVSVDNRAGIRAVMDHLTGLGHRRIGFLAGRRLGDILEREEAYGEFMGGIGEPVREGYVQYAPNDPTGGVRALAAMLDLAEPPTAVVASTDVLAFGLLFGAHARGIQVPRDLSVTGFDDIPLAAFSVPALTTVRMPVREMVDAALRMLIDDAGATDGERSPILEPSLVVRSSTSRLEA